MDSRKTITVGRVKGSMVYSGTDFQVEKPLENDLYLHSEEYSFYQYKGKEWVKVADLDDHSLETDGISIGTSDNYNTNSDNEIPTTKTVKKLIDDIPGVPTVEELEANVSELLERVNSIDLTEYATKQFVRTEISNAITNTLNTEV